MNLFRLITFDVTGTLLKFRVPPMEKYAEVGRLFGAPVKQSVLATNFQNSFRHMSSKHPNFGRKTGLGWRNWWRNVVVNTFQPDVSKEPRYIIDKVILDNIAEFLIDSYTNSESWQLIEHCDTFLSSTYKSGIPLGIISNFDERLETILESVCVRQYFDFILTSYSAGCEKPDPRIFNIALTKLNRTLKPSEAFHVGNDPRLDYYGATDAGWNAALIHSHPEDFSKIGLDRPIPSHVVFSNFAKLQTFLNT
ncbi:unnamed protein product [Timema podura]|uniref:Rhythmically expressed gene 2 protein n=1 Tax=Timema podura TaxID=61482 RepID=A0ABN7P9Y6_TIMPD|nr:unnamed protein product [Timema podura]